MQQNEMFEVEYENFTSTDEDVDTQLNTSKVEQKTIL